MTDRWALVRDLVIRALELPATQRRAFVRSECGEDAALAAEVLRVVESRHEAGEDFLEPPEYLISQEPTEKTRFDDFEIVRELGRGGMGTVFLARQNALDRYVALKVFVEGFLTSSSQVERFHREASSVARLSHTGIVPVYASGSDGPTHWYAMEYIAGHDLSQEIARLKEGGSSSAKEGRGFLFAPGEPEHPRAIAKVVAKVAQALQYAHEHGLVHRDVKPQNILLREDGTALLTDFGIARDERFGSLTRSGELQGTPHYMSPEQARVTEATVDHRTDVYSLGVVLYELATLQRPHEGATHAALLADLREREAQPIQRLNPGFPRDLATICEKALRKEPEERYATAGELAVDLENFLAGQPIQARRRSLFEQARGALLRNRGQILAMVAIVVAASLAWFFAASKSSSKLTVRGVPPGQRVGVEVLDPIVGGVKSREWYGEGDLVSLRAAPGYIRVVVGAPGSPSRQFTRLLQPGELASLQLRGKVTAPDLQGMVFVPGGTVHTQDDSPGARTIALNQTPTAVADFYLDATEVSNAEYRSYLDATGALAPEHWSGLKWPDDANLPVVGVSCSAAINCAYGMGTGWPSYPEWILAARGKENRPYPWPDAIPEELRGNVGQSPVGLTTTLEEYRRRAAPVESFPEARTATGIWHLFGNVGEMTESVVAEPQGEPTQMGDRASAFRPMLLSGRITAGHSWRAASGAPYASDLTICGMTFGLDRARVSLTRGFRCAVGVVPVH